MNRTSSLNSRLKPSLHFDEDDNIVDDTEYMFVGLKDDDNSSNMEVATFDDDGTSQLIGKVVQTGGPVEAVRKNIDITGRNLLPNPWIIFCLFNGYVLVQTNETKVRNSLIPIMDSIINWVRLGMDMNDLPTGCTCVYTYNTQTGETECLDYSEYVSGDDAKHLILSIALKDRGELNLTYPLSILGLATNVKTINKLIRFTGYQLRRRG